LLAHLLTTLLSLVAVEVVGQMVAGQVEQAVY
jgi:hypothetical protein